MYLKYAWSVLMDTIYSGCIRLDAISYVEETVFI